MTLAGKQIVVTGGTDGIGKVTARELARLGATVTIIGRNAAKGDSVIRELRNATGKDAIHFVHADLSLRKGVNQAAAQLKERMGQLDVLVNNAGGMFATREVTADGIERTLALNHLAYFSLTAMVMDLLRAAGEARIVSVSSQMHAGTTLDMQDLQNEKDYSGWTAYSRSKLANVYFTYELARRLEGTKITANCLHPGFVASSFGNNNGIVTRLLFGLAKSVAAVNVDAGARTSIYLASSPEVDGVSGRYFDKCKDVKSSPASYDTETAKYLWERTESLCSLSLK